MKSIVSLLLISYFLSAGHSPVHAQRFVIPDLVPDLDGLKEEDKSKLLKFFKNMRHVRKIVYGNVHAIFECTPITNIGNEKKRPTGDGGVELQSAGEPLKADNKIGSRRAAPAWTDGKAIRPSPQFMAQGFR